VFQVLRRFQQVAALFQQLGAGLVSTTRGPFEFLHAKVILELADGVGNGRGHAVQFLAGGGKRTAPVDGVHDLQGFQA
jgi:hypothetical protein